MVLGHVRRAHARAAHPRPADAARPASPTQAKTQEVRRRGDAHRVETRAASTAKVGHGRRRASAVGGLSAVTVGRGLGTGADGREQLSTR